MTNPGNHRVYRKHAPLKILIRIIAILLVLAVVLSVTVFFGFRRYIVYTDDGLYLDIPWLREGIASTPSGKNSQALPAAG